MATALNAIRSACPSIPIGVSTGAWIEPNLEDRLALLASWEVLPDFASVNFDEPGAEGATRLLLARGVGVEAGLNSVEAARRFITFNRAVDALRILIEPPEECSSRAKATAQAIEVVLDAQELNCARLLHGFGEAAWSMIEMALRRGYDTRIGFEDTLVLPDGQLAHSNAELVRAVGRMAGAYMQT